MNSKFFGIYTLVLHSHIPYVLHHDRMNEEWLYEAAAETYLPLLNIFYQLIHEGISPQVTINISPVLAEQLVNPYFIKAFQDYCDQKISLAKEDAEKFSQNPLPLRSLAKDWQKFYQQTKKSFMDKYDGNIVEAFSRLQKCGHIEIITCGATHAYLPALCEDTSIRAQIQMARLSYERLFGVSPGGIWLPECGYRPSGLWTHPLTHYKHEPAHYRPGVEEFLVREGIYYFIIDQEQFQKSSYQAADKTPWGTYSLTNQNLPAGQVTLFVRDKYLSEQIWNFEVGYPGDGGYLDFHKKHLGSGNRYWKITDKKLDMAYKEIYSPEKVRSIIIQHAGHHKWSIKRTLVRQFQNTNVLGLKVAAFDAELFGHWWFEGPTWLYELIKWINRDPEIKMLTCSAYKEKYPSSHSVHLPESSWGKAANSSTWINPGLEWVWERIYGAEKEMRSMARHFKDQKDPFGQRILRQCIRELLILQSSDWEFMITTNSTRDHGERRIVEHHEDFKKLVQLAYKWEKNRHLDNQDMNFLKECEEREDLFPDPDPGWYN